MVFFFFFFLLFSPLCQTIVLSLLMRSIGNKNTILLGLGFQILQLAWYGFGSEPWYVNVILISERHGIFLHFILYLRETLKCAYVSLSTRVHTHAPNAGHRPCRGVTSSLYFLQDDVGSRSCCGHVQYYFPSCKRTGLPNC